MDQTFDLEDALDPHEVREGIGERFCISHGNRQVDDNIHGFADKVGLQIKNPDGFRAKRLQDVGDQGGSVIRGDFDVDVVGGNAKVAFPVDGNEARPGRDVGAACAMDRDAFPFRNVSDDIVARDRRAAASQGNCKARRRRESCRIPSAWPPFSRNLRVAASSGFLGHRERRSAWGF